MATDNRISMSISDEVKQQILTKLQEIDALLPDLVNLTPEERRSLPRMATARGAMDATFAQQMAAHPELVPGFVDLAEMTKDRTLRLTLLELASRVAELASRLEDTAQVAGSDLYMTYMAFYSNVQQAAKRGVAAAVTVLNYLKEFIPRGRSTSSTTTPPTQP